MNDDIPIFKKSYGLYKLFYSYRLSVPRHDRYTLWQKCESLLIEMLENIMRASQTGKLEKVPFLEAASNNLNFLRVFIRLMKDVRALDTKRYVALQSEIDEIGRMLGGWLRSTKE